MVSISKSIKFKDVIESFSKRLIDKCFSHKPNEKTNTGDNKLLILIVREPSSSNAFARTQNYTEQGFVAEMHIFRLPKHQVMILLFLRNEINGCLPFSLLEDQK